MTIHAPTPPQEQARILVMLGCFEQLTVHDLSRSLRLSRPAVEYHLRALARREMVASTVVLKPRRPKRPGGRGLLFAFRRAA